MHLRGKDMTYQIEYPDGKRETVLSVPHYDFNWQLGYELAEPIKLPKGSKLVVVAHYDNSREQQVQSGPESHGLSGQYDLGGNVHAFLRRDGGQEASIRRRCSRFRSRPPTEARSLIADRGIMQYWYGNR